MKFFKQNHEYSLLLAQMSRFSELLWSIRDPKKLQVNILRSFRDMSDAQNASLLLYDKKSGSFDIKESFGGDPLQQRLLKGDKLILFVQKNNKPIFKKDIHESDSFIDIRSHLLAYFSSFQADILIPLWFEQKLIGIINLGLAQMPRDIAERVMLLQLMAGVSCVALDHATIYSQLEEQKNQLLHWIEVKNYYENELKPDLTTGVQGMLNMIDLLLSESVGPLNVDQRRYLEMIQGACGSLMELADHSESSNL